ncbi:UvrD-helicase domain-containing protein [Shigella flexneri]
MAAAFTNKAGGRDAPPYRAATGTSQGGMWVGTFHGRRTRLLRAHHMDANLPQHHRISSGHQLCLLKRLIKAINLDEKQWPPRQAMWYMQRSERRRAAPHHIQSFGNPVETWQNVDKAIRSGADRAVVWWISPEPPPRAHGAAGLNNAVPGTLP